MFYSANNSAQSNIYQPLSRMTKISLNERLSRLINDSIYTIGCWKKVASNDKLSDSCGHFLPLRWLITGQTTFICADLYNEKDSVVRRSVLFLVIALLLLYRVTRSLVLQYTVTQVTWACHLNESGGDNVLSKHIHTTICIDELAATLTIKRLRLFHEYLNTHFLLVNQEYRTNPYRDYVYLSPKGQKPHSNLFYFMGPYGCCTIEPQA